MDKEQIERAREFAIRRIGDGLDRGVIIEIARFGKDEVARSRKETDEKLQELEYIARQYSARHPQEFDMDKSNYRYLKQNLEGEGQSHSWSGVLENDGK